MKNLLGLVCIFVLGFVAGVVWHREAVVETAPPSGATTEARRAVPAREDPLERIAFSDVTLSRGDYGMFAGSIKLENHTDRSMPVLVTVHVYNGPDNIADLSEMTTMKPGTMSTVQLTSGDDYRAYTDTTVDLLPLG